MTQDQRGGLALLIIGCALIATYHPIGIFGCLLAFIGAVVFIESKS